MIRAKGFSLVELMVTLAILSVLATVSLPMLQLSVQRTKEKELREALFAIRGAIDAYKYATEQGVVPMGVDESGYPKKLEDLIVGMDDQKSVDKRHIYFLRRLPRDPFFSDTSAPPEATWGLRSYASPPDDPREGDDVFDVYSLAQGTGLNGIPYREW